MNLGSPDSTSVSDVRKYLTEFLMDERVIDKPFLIRTLLVKGIISPFRAPKSAEAYHTIWTKEGSPLVVITHQQQKALQQQIAEPVAVAMRYGNPTMKFAYDKILSENPGLEEVILLPLYPHYAMSSFETAVEHAKTVYSQGKYPFKITTVPPFYNHPAYIKALAESIKSKLAPSSHLLFSYHSIPEGHIMKSDITGNHCFKSADCCTTDSPAHQSKLGRAEWLKPATTMRMEQMPGEGIKDLAVVCPAFVSDCLETLEEVAIRERENFMNAGGEKFTFIPCMNIQPAWIDAMMELVGVKKK